MQSAQDYVWRFAVEANSSPSGYQDPLVEMVRTFLSDFLNLGFLTRDGERVRVDGFVFASDTQRIYDIFPSEAAPGGGPSGKNASDGE